MDDDAPKVKLWTKDFILISAINFFLFASWQMFPSVLPVYLQSLGASDIELGLITTITTIAALLIRPFGGLLLDRFGRRGILIAGIAFMVVSVCAYSIFSAIFAIFVVRFLHGLSWGIASTSSQTVASDVIPPKRFGEGMGLFALSASLALAIAPGFALELFDREGFLPVVWVAIGFLLGAFGLSFLFKLVKTQVSQPFCVKNVFERTSLVPALLVLCLTMCYGGLITFLALHAAAQGVEGIGIFFTAYAIAVALSRPILGKVVDRRGYGVIIVPGLVAMVVSLVLLAFADSLILFVAVAFLFGFGFAACNSTLQTMAVADIPSERRGAANATYLVGFDSGIGLGALISGIVVSHAGYSGLYLCFAALPIIAGVFFFLCARKRKPPALRNK